MSVQQLRTWARCSLEAFGVEAEQAQLPPTHGISQDRQHQEGSVLPGKQPNDFLTTVGAFLLTSSGLRICRAAAAQRPRAILAELSQLHLGTEEWGAAELPVP